MTVRHLHAIFQQFDSFSPAAEVADCSDRELLRRFAQSRDESAFAVLMRRHAALVFGVCHRMLPCRQDAEDVFQATFFVLARKASSLRWRDSISGWLFAVAHRLALKCRATTSRQRCHELHAEPVTRQNSPVDSSIQELCAVLDDELRTLPERYRLPLLLCYLEGQTRDQAARQMGWSLRTLHRRLERGLSLLRIRLTARDLTLSGALLAASMSKQSASAQLASAFLRGTLRAAIAFSERTSKASSSPAILAEAGIQSMMPAKGKFLLGLLLVVGVFATGAGVMTHRRPQRDTEANAAMETPRSPRSEPTVNPHEKSAQKRVEMGELPNGAVARLGTNWLRGGRHRHFLPDGKRFVQPRNDDEALLIAAVPSGKPLVVLHGSDVPGKKEVVASTIGFTRDSKYLAAVCWDGGCGIWETATGKLVRSLDSGRFYSIVQCDFSPDGKYLAVGAGAPQGQLEGITVGVYEVATGKRLFTTPGTNSVFAPDGKTLVTWDGYRHGATTTARRLEVPSGKELKTISYLEGFPDFAPRSDGVWFFEIRADKSILAWDVATGEVKHTFRGPQGGNDKVVYVRHVAGQRELLAVSTQPPAVWCWNLETGKELWQQRLATPAYYPSLSEDGKTLVTGETKGPIRVWDVSSGKERVSFRSDTIGHYPYQILVSADGKTIATDSGGSFSAATAFWDAISGKLLTHLPGHSAGITAAAYSPDGGRIYTVGKDRTLRTWDAATGQELSSVLAEPAIGLAVSPDGKTLYTAALGSGSIRLLDAQTGRRVRELTLFKTSLFAFFLTAEGKKLVAAGSDAYRGNPVVRICDTATGATQQEVAGSEFGLEQLAIRPDGGAIATSYPDQHVRLWDGKGKKIADEVGHGKRGPSRDNLGLRVKGRIGSLALSADGRWLAYSDQEEGIVVVDARNGKELGRAKTDVYFQSPSARDDVRDVLAFSPDSKTIAWSGVESTLDIFLIEARTQKVRQRFPGDSNPVQHLVFSPDGSQLLSAGPDGSALLWDLRGHAPLNPVTAEQVSGWWKALSNDDAGKAYQTMQEMAAHPTEAVTLLRKELLPIRAVPAVRFDALLGKLDADDFKEREAASRELVALGDAVESQLRKTLSATPGLELRRRTEEVLQRIDEGRLRSERAIEVLEMIGDTTARKLLRDLSGGLPDAPRTVDAAQTLRRLSARRSHGQ